MVYQVILPRAVVTFIKTDSAQSSSNKCKNYSLKFYSQHLTLINFSKSPCDQILLSILQKVNVKPHKNVKACVIRVSTIVGLA